MSQAEAALAVKSATQELIGFDSGAFHLWVRRYGRGYYRMPIKIRRIRGDVSEITAYVETEARRILGDLMLLLPDVPPFHLSIACDEIGYLMNGNEYRQKMMAEEQENGINSHLVLQ